MRDDTGRSAAAQNTIAIRVLDALLREDVRACASQGVPLPSRHDDDPSHPAPSHPHRGPWLRVAHLPGGHLWLPVHAATFMQQWRSAGLPLLWRADGGAWRALGNLDEVLDVFSAGLPAAGAALFRAFADECRLAVAHRVLADEERSRWFAQRPARPDSWHASLLHYDRVAAFHDHPLYPTARAKLGFDDASLAAYGPETRQTFELRWLALPRTLVHASGGPAAAPWPSFEDVGLDAALGATHALLPVHPFVWGGQLQSMLEEAGLAPVALRAPRAWLRVTPTLSVRTLALADTPAWHIKVPLTIRTLGAKNIRTIKPSTIADGHRVQSLLGAIAAQEPALAGRVLLTDERHGAHADHRPFLGYILRRYPAPDLEGADVVAVAALAAPASGGGLVAQELAQRWYGGDLPALFADYLELTLELHLLLWLRYGVALESNQQNSVVVLDRAGGRPRLRVLLKDNDAARIHMAALARRWPALARHVAQLDDARIAVDGQLPLAQMFTTITLQLNIAALVEALAAALAQPPAALYRQVRERIAALLHRFAQEGEDTAPARRVLLDDERLYLKCLLVAATLAEKSDTGAADINKFYGHSAPNFLRGV